MIVPSQELGYKKLGHDGFPVIANPSGAPGDVDGDGPPPPSYDEVLSYERSEVTYSETSSTNRTQISVTTASCSRSAYQPTSSSSYGPGLSSSQAVLSNHDPATERPTSSPRHQPHPPHVLLPPAVPPPAPGNSESFTRARPPHLSYGPFPPAVLHARSNDLLRDGFPLEPPTCSCTPQPHPFVTHDVNEDDWARFLRDVARVGGLTPVDSMLVDAAPRAVRTGGLVGFIADMALRAHIEGKKRSPVADVIADWNLRFFHPRHMDVVLAQGSITYTGPEDALPPDMVWQSHNRPTDGAGYVRAHDDDPHFDERRGIGRRAGMGRRGIGRRLDESDRRAGRMDDGACRTGRRGLLRELAGLSGSGVTDVRERVDYSRDLQASARERWRLIVAYKPPTVHDIASNE